MENLPGTQEGSCKKFKNGEKKRTNAGNRQIGPVISFQSPERE
jgi:hypothetical protein